MRENSLLQKFGEVQTNELFKLITVQWKSKKKKGEQRSQLNFCEAHERILNVVWIPSRPRMKLIYENNCYTPSHTSHINKDNK